VADIRGQIESAAGRYADSPALIDGARNLTWRQLGATARLAAGQLRDRGVYTWGNVAVSGHNSWLPPCDSSWRRWSAAST